MERDCFNCKHSYISGKHLPATRLDPEEFPEAECNYEGHGDIDRFFNLLEKAFKHIDDFITAENCPFYESN